MCPCGGDREGGEEGVKDSVWGGGKGEWKLITVFQNKLIMGACLGPGSIGRKREGNVCGSYVQAARGSEVVCGAR